MAKSGIIHKAARKARRYIARVVYVVRDSAGRVHYTLSNRIKGTLLALCASWRDGSLFVLRHPA